MLNILLGSTTFQSLVLEARLIVLRTSKSRPSETSAISARAIVMSHLFRVGGETTP